jgi:hypothetical protein
VVCGGDETSRSMCGFLLLLILGPTAVSAARGLLANSDGVYAYRLSPTFALAGTVDFWLGSPFLSS